MLCVLFDRMKYIRKDSSNVISAINFPVCCSDVHKFNIRKELERMMSR